MRIGLVSTAVPHINSGARFIVDWLNENLIARGHEVEVIYIPSTDELDHILPQMAAISMMKLDEYFDRVITLRPPSHMVQHPRKVVWFIHHTRMFYDLWDTEYRPFPDNAANRSLRSMVMTADTNKLTDCYKLFTNSRVLSERVKTFNGLNSEVLYPPVLRPERFRSGPYGDEIVSVCRLEQHKRQHLLVEALGVTTTQVRLRLCGLSNTPGYIDELLQMSHRLGVADRITIENVWITEDEKADRLETALASAYVPFDEDSYGYPTIEAAHAERCTITLTDSGGVLEFVIDGENGLITEPTPEAIAAAFDRLYADRAIAQRLGRKASARVAELGIDWDTVVEKLLG